MVIIEALSVGVFNKSFVLTICSVETVGYQGSLFHFEWDKGAVQWDLFWLKQWVHRWWNTGRVM